MNDIEHGLILEDHADAREWLAQAVVGAFSGIDLVSCVTVGDAITTADECALQLALVDLQLPDGSGIELIEHLNQHQPECLVIVATVYEDDTHLFSALRAGAHGYVLKDEPQESVRQMLHGIVAGRPALSPKIARRLLDHFRPEESVSQPALTEREEDVLALLAKGFTVKKVADLLEISPNTAAGYVKTIYRKLNISSRAEATLEASHRGLVGSSI